MKPDGLYDLLPAFLRVADAAEGEPLRALMGVLQREHQAIQTDLAQLYEDWFIETCEDWAVPYLGDLLGVRGLDSPDLYRGSQRALVGNVLAYRRRKGVARVLAAAARAATGWPSLAVSSHGLLGMTQRLSHPRPEKGGTVDLRHAEALDRLGGPFDTLAHTIDVRRHARFNLLRLGLFLWRLASFPVALAAPREVREGCYTFHPFGIDSPLFNPPRTGEADPAAALPGPLDGRVLADEVRILCTGGEPAGARLLDSRQPALRVFVRPRGGQGPLQALPPQSLLFCDLADWRRPAPWRAYLRADGTTVKQPVRAAVDPALGRLTLPAGVAGDEVLVSYAYGFSDDLGGGPYARQPAALPGHGAWLAFVHAGAAAGAPPEGGPPAFPTLQAALSAAAGHPRAVIRLADNGAYDLPPVVRLAPHQDLTLQAIDGMRPCLRGEARVSGREENASSLTLEGLWIDGRIVLGGGIRSLRIADCTLRPPRPGEGPAASLTAGDGAVPPDLTIELSRCIAGPLRLPGGISGLAVERSIVDGGAGVALAGPDGASPGPPATFDGCTVFGEVRARQLLRAESTIFTGRVSVSDPAVGTVGFCHVPEGSVTPLRHPPPGSRPPRPPVFTATVYGQPGYAQLAPDNPAEIAAGARDGSEIGVFHHLRQPQRLASLPGTIAEYLRCGHEAAVVFVT